MRLLPVVRQIAEQEYQERGLANFDSLAPYLDRDYLLEKAHKSAADSTPTQSG